MVANNRETHRTDFTVSVDAAEGVTTGISAQDRTRTIRILADPEAKPEQLVQPGHVFPLRSRPGGVLERAGHTEAAVDLAVLADQPPSGVLCELVNDDGTVQRLPQLQEFRDRFGLKMISIAQLIEYRARRDRLVEPVSRKPFPSEYGEFTAPRLPGPARRPASPGADHGRARPGADPRPGPDREPPRRRLPDARPRHPPIAGRLPRGGRPGRPRGRPLPRARERGRRPGPPARRPARGAAARDTFATTGSGPRSWPRSGCARSGCFPTAPRKVVGLDGHGLEIVEQVPSSHHEPPRTLRLPPVPGAPFRVGSPPPGTTSASSRRSSARCFRALGQAGVRDRNLAVVRVPGSNELPVAAQLLAGARPDVVVALGVIIRGGTIHYELIAEATTQALQRVALDSGIPVINGVVVAENARQAAGAAPAGSTAARSSRPPPWKWPRFEGSSPDDQDPIRPAARRPGRGRPVPLRLEPEPPGQPGRGSPALLREPGEAPGALRLRRGADSRRDRPRRGHRRPDQGPGSQLGVRPDRQDRPGDPPGRDLRDALPAGHPPGRLDQRGDRPLEGVLQRRRQAVHQRHPRPAEGPARAGRAQGGYRRADRACSRSSRAGLAKTVSAISARTHGLFGGRKIDAASLGELEEALYTADFGVETTGEIMAEIKAAARQDPELRGRRPPR